MAIEWQKRPKDWILHVGAFSARIHRDGEYPWTVVLTFGGTTQRTETLLDGRSGAIKDAQADAVRIMRRWIVDLHAYAPNALKLLEGVFTMQVLVLVPCKNHPHYAVPCPHGCKQ